MAMFPAASRRRFAPGISSLPALLATTSVAALLLGTPLPAHAAGISGPGTHCPAPPAEIAAPGNAPNVDNPANTTVTSIVVNAANVTGAVTNEGTVKPGKAVTVNGVTVTASVVVTNSTIGQGIANSGTITASAQGVTGIGILVSGS